jgi:hypothetical protein
MGLLELCFGAALAALHWWNFNRSSQATLQELSPKQAIRAALRRWVLTLLVGWVIVQWPGLDRRHFLLSFLVASYLVRAWLLRHYRSRPEQKSAAAEVAAGECRRFALRTGD